MHISCIHGSWRVSRGRCGGERRCGCRPDLGPQKGISELLFANGGDEQFKTVVRALGVRVFLEESGSIGRRCIGAEQSGLPGVHLELNGGAIASEKADREHPVASRRLHSIG